MSTFSRPIASPMNPMSSIPGRDTLGAREMSDGRALIAVVVDEDIAGDADGKEVDPGAAHHLVGAQRDRDERVDQADEGTRRDAAEQPQEPGAEQVGSEDPEEGADQHHALEPDVDHAAALGQDAAHRGEDQRRGEPEHAGRQRGPHEDAIEVALAGVHRHHGQDSAEHRDRDGDPAEPALALAHGIEPGQHAQHGEKQRDQGRANQERRQGHVCRQDPERDPEPGGRARRHPGAGRCDGRRAHGSGSPVAGAAVGGGPLRLKIPRPRLTSPSTSTSALTIRTTRPWMM